MKKLMVSAFALAMMTTGAAMAGQPVTLTDTQLDRVSAAGFAKKHFKRHGSVTQVAVAKAASAAICGICGVNASAATATAANVNVR